MTYNDATNISSTIRELDDQEIDEVAGGRFSISFGDGGVSVEAGRYSLSVWSDGAVYGNGSSYQYYHW